MWKFDCDKVNRYAYIKSAFTKQECAAIIDLYGKGNLTESSIYKNGVSSLDSKVRDSSIMFFGPDAQNRWIYEKLSSISQYLNNEFFKFDVSGFEEGLQFTRYTAPGGNYNYHVDKIFNGPIRKLSVVVQLSESSDYEGGDFQFLDGVEPDNLIRDIGSVLAFPSYSLHRVSAVTKGTRHSLVGWISGPNFK